MGRILTRQQIDQFHEQGFVSPVGVMSEDEAACYLAQLEAAERDYPREINPENRNNAHLSFGFLDQIAHHPLILDAVEDLIGPNISLWGSVLFIKEPQSRSFVSWHQDATYVGVEPHDFVTPWLALTPSDRESGCMSVIPASHHDHVRDHVDTFAEDNILTRGQLVQDVDEIRAVDLKLRPGQMSLHNAEIVHGSRPNHSGRRRVGFALQAYMPAHVRQLVGENYWLQIRGNNHREGTVALHRPRFDMDPVGVADRKRANDNWAEILYHGAAKIRAY